MSTTMDWMDLDTNVASVKSGGPDHFGIDGTHNIVIDDAAVVMNEHFQKRELQLRGHIVGSMSGGRNGSFTVALEPFDKNDVDSIRDFADNFRTACAALGIDWPENKKLRDVINALPGNAAKVRGAVVEANIVRKQGKQRKDRDGNPMVDKDHGEALYYTNERVYLRRNVKPAPPIGGDDLGVAAVAQTFGGTPAGNAADDDIPF